MSDISSITDHLFISSHLTDASIRHLKPYNFGLIISMIGPTLPKDALSESGCKLLFLRSQDHFLFPIPNNTLIQGVVTALPFLAANKKVLIYCHQGRRRSVTMAAAILMAQGYNAVDASALIKKQREVATPYMFYVKWRIRKFEKYWKEHGHRHA